MITWIFLGVIILIMLIGFLFTGVWKFLVLAVFCIVSAFIYLLVDKMKPTRTAKENVERVGKRVIGTVLVTGIVLVFPPLFVSSFGLWQYPMQSAFLNLYHNNREPEWFPEFSKDVERNFEFSYMPSVLQGNGWYSVCFETTKERAAEYEAEYASQAQFIIPVSDYLNQIVDLKACAADGKVKDNAVFECYIDREFWDDAKNEESKAMIYVLSTNLDWNHASASVVIVDAETCKVQLSEL